MQKEQLNIRKIRHQKGKIKRRGESCRRYCWVHRGSGSYIFWWAKSSIENKDPNKLVETLAEGEKLIVSYAEDSGNKTEVLTEEDVVTPQACGPTVCVLVVVAGVYLYVGGVQGVVLQTGAAITTGIWKYVAYTSSSVQQAYAIEQAAVETLDMLTEQSGK